MKVQASKKIQRLAGTSRATFRLSGKKCSALHWSPSDISFAKGTGDERSVTWTP
jgi:hypothetical protein